MLDELVTGLRAWGARFGARLRLRDYEGVRGVETVDALVDGTEVTTQRRGLLRSLSDPPPDERLAQIASLPEGCLIWAHLLRETCPSAHQAVQPLLRRLYDPADVIYLTLFLLKDAQNTQSVFQQYYRSLPKCELG